MPFDEIKVKFCIYAGVTCFYINDDQGIDMERLRKGLKQFNDSS